MLGSVPGSTSSVIAFVPMYATPVARQFPPLLGKIAGIEVREPARSMLGGYIEPGDVAGVAGWLQGPAVAGAGAFVVSTDMLAYGGLNASRVPGGVDAQLAISRLRLIERLRKDHPQAWIAAFGTVMRLEPTAVAPVGAAAQYDPIARFPTWQYITAYANLHAPPLPSEAQQAQTLRQQIGEPILQSYLTTRARDLAVDLEILEMVGRRSIDRLVLGQDDAGPVGLHVGEVRALQDRVARLEITDRASIEPGADELGLALVAHAMTHSISWTPRIAVRYSMPGGASVQDPLEFAPISVTIGSLIRLCGAVSDDARPDVILFVRVPNTDGGADDALLRNISQDLSSGRSVALVDLSFLSSYAQQAAFVQRLIDAGIAAKLDSYSSWNTDANSVGIALSEAIAAGVGRKRGSYSATAHAEFRAMRYLDDYLYHDVVRPELNAYLQSRGISDHTYLAPDVWADAQRQLQTLLLPRAHDLIRRTFPNYEVARLSVSLPWPRTFEMESEVRLVPASRGFVTVEVPEPRRRGVAPKPESSRAKADPSR